MFDEMKKIAETMLQISNTMGLINQSLQETQVVQAQLIKQMDILNDRVDKLEKKVG